jgi:hypothetical protein
MSRQGRGLETLVRDLEIFLAKTPVTVTSPDYIPGRRTGVPREVDVSIKGNFGTASILAIIECRQRKASQDVTWIEQIASKKEDVGAHYAIAVSSSPFTRGAITLAKNVGIELRTFTEIDEGVVLGWATQLFSGVRCYKMENSGLMVKMSRATGPILMTDGQVFAKDAVRLDEPHFRLQDGSMKSLHEVFIAEANNYLLVNFPADVTEWESDYSIDLIERGLAYNVQVKGEEFEVKQISASFKITLLSTQDVVFGPTLRYGSDSGLETHSSQGRISSDDVNLLIAVHENGSEKAVTVGRDDAENDKMVTLAVFAKPDPGDFSASGDTES